MKILISAYSCEPGQGSERGIGWNIVREIARYNDVWVLTRPDESKEVIEAELARHPVPNLHFVYFTLPFWQDSLRWGQSGAMQVHYYLWQIQAYFVARRLHQEIKFDLAHHVTFAKYWNPSFLSLLSIPFIWGPVGGGESTPKTFWHDFSLSAKLYETARDLGRWLGERDPFVYLTAKRSVYVGATTEDTAKRLYRLGVNHVHVSSAIALSAEEVAHFAKYEILLNGPVRFISVGRLLHWKGFHLGLKAFAQANLPDAEYWIVGDGPEWDRLHTLAQNLGIDRQVKFWGRLSRQDTLNKLGECHILIHPSLHDSGGLVSLEAMAAGRPVICLDLGGPGVLVTPETGFKVLAHDPDQAVCDLAAATVQLAQNPELRTNMAQAGRNLIQETYTWKLKGECLNTLYEKIIQDLSSSGGFFQSNSKIKYELIRGNK